MINRKQFHDLIMKKLSEDYADSENSDMNLVTDNEKKYFELFKNEKNHDFLDALTKWISDVFENNVNYVAYDNMIKLGKVYIRPQKEYQMEVSELKQLWQYKSTNVEVGGLYSNHFENIELIFTNCENKKIEIYDEYALLPSFKNLMLEAYALYTNTEKKENISISELVGIISNKDVFLNNQDIVFKEFGNFLNAQKDLVFSTIIVEDIIENYSCLKTLNEKRNFLLELQNFNNFKSVAKAWKLNNGTLSYRQLENKVEFLKIVAEGAEMHLGMYDEFLIYEQSPKLNMANSPIYKKLLLDSNINKGSYFNSLSPKRFRNDYLSYLSFKSESNESSERFFRKIFEKNNEFELTRSNLKVFAIEYDLLLEEKDVREIEKILSSDKFKNEKDWIICVDNYNYNVKYLVNNVRDVNKLEYFVLQVIDGVLQEKRKINKSSVDMNKRVIEKVSDSLRAWNLKKELNNDAKKHKAKKI